AIRIRAAGAAAAAGRVYGTNKNTAQRGQSNSSAGEAIAARDLSGSAGGAGSSARIYAAADNHRTGGISRERLTAGVKTTKGRRDYALNIEILGNCTIYRTCGRPGNISG